MPEHPQSKHEAFRSNFAGERELKYALDFLKVMPSSWTDEERLYVFVQLYDELVDWLDNAHDVMAQMGKHIDSLARIEHREEGDPCPTCLKPLLWDAGQRMVYCEDDYQHG